MPVELEPQRPLYHFTAQKGWLNDPNGLVFYKGEYHLFFQHNPHGTAWGNMTWGHAVSRDLVRWTQVENAISPDAMGTMFSGSAVIDKKNTSGLGLDALVLLYTAAGGTNEESKGKPFTQGLAWSSDGRMFTKLDKNPILGHIEHENRDPKVVWFEPTKSWVMSLYINEDRFALFGSKDLTSWSKLSDVKVPGTAECPDFFPLALDGNKKQKFWVFSGANGNYQIGSFDGIRFTPVGEILRSNYGSNSYAAQTFFNDPKGRTIQIAWMQGSDFANVAWNQQMSLPRKLTLRSTALGARLFTEPVEELKSLRSKRLKPKKGQNRLDFETIHPAIETVLEARVPKVGFLKLTFAGREVTYNAQTYELKTGSTTTVVPPSADKLRLHVFADTASIEVFAQDGLFSVPTFQLASTQSPGAHIEFDDTWSIAETTYELKSASEKG